MGDRLRLHAIFLAGALGSIACGGGTKVTTSTHVSEVKRNPAPLAPCGFGDSPAVQVRVVAGYPATLSPPLSKEELEAKKKRLESRLPGWRMDLDARGFVTFVASTNKRLHDETPIGPWEVQPVVTALASELDLPANARVVSDGLKLRVEVPGEPLEGRRFGIQKSATWPSDGLIWFSAHPRRLSKADFPLDEFRCDRTADEPAIAKTRRIRSPSCRLASPSRHLGLPSCHLGPPSLRRRVPSCRREVASRGNSMRASW